MDGWRIRLGVLAGEQINGAGLRGGESWNRAFFWPGGKARRKNYGSYREACPGAFLILYGSLMDFNLFRLCQDAV